MGCNAGLLILLLLSGMLIPLIKNPTSTFTSFMSNVIQCELNQFKTTFSNKQLEK